ncbi:helix-turn-helix transcriptional regulator [Bacillus pseudomycoides]|uniref:helix-turn-helix domain-containing protein n=1 Tax=Bacillus pseudomycoides TaxID=64104 RepID=UPI0001A167DA|nr:helix-turn-helix transcriptional regulator [Bacillus pseudomycoides]EEM06209.1 transcriptional regulator [Bacillus pseudomycoides]
MGFYVDIKRLTRKRGITLDQLSDKTGIHKANLSRMAYGEPVTMRTVNKIAIALNIKEANELLTFRKEEY